MTNATLRGKPDAGNPHVRFDEGEVASAKPRRGSLLYKLPFPGLLALACVGTASAIPLTSLKWRLSGDARITDDVLTVDVPAGTKKTSWATVDVDVSAWTNRTIYLSVKGTGASARQKVMIAAFDRKLDRGDWPEAPSYAEPFTNAPFVTAKTLVGADIPKVTLYLGLQSQSGHISFDLKSGSFGPGRDFAPYTNTDYVVSYPARVAEMPRLRGVMSPVVPQERDFADLHAMGATLMRYQMHGSGHEAKDASVAERLAHFDAWLEERLVYLERNMLAWGRKYGIRILVDLHGAPGGIRHNTMRMMTDPVCADRFVAAWRKIATRLKGNADVIYGYDLINEPGQHEVPLPGHDYWSLQRRAAEAVRAIDPDTTIVVESDRADIPSTYPYLMPLAMDNVIYEVHLYHPNVYTHQGVGSGRSEPRSYPEINADGTVFFDREAMRRELAPVREFQLRHHARIMVGEFSAIVWAHGADQYLADAISLFEEYGWDWTFHAFREWEAWSFEHEGPFRSHLNRHENLRGRVVTDGFRGIVHPSPDVSTFTPEEKRLHNFKVRASLRPTLFKRFTDEANTPNSFARDPCGNLYVSVPNQADPRHAPRILRMDAKTGQWSTFLELPKGQIPLGLDFAPDGTLYYCDSQYFANPGYRSCIRRVEVDRATGKPARTSVVVTGIKLANSVRVHEDALFLTDTFFDLPGRNLGGIYRVPLAACRARPVRLLPKTSCAQDPYLLGTTESVRPAWRGGDGAACCDGLAFDADGNLYTGNFGNGRLHVLRRRTDGSYEPPLVLLDDVARQSSCDGICYWPAKNWIFMSDPDKNAVNAWDITHGKFFPIWRNGDATGEDGSLDQPDDVIVWGDKLLVVDYDCTFPGITNTKNDAVHSLSVIDLSHLLFPR